MSDPMPFGALSFAENPEPRCPVVLLLDTSGSMGGKPLMELQAGLAQYKDELAADSLASKRVEVAVVTFGGEVRTASDFTTADAFQPPQLQAGGQTPMGEAIVRALDMIQERKTTYRQNGILFYRPWVFLITDGAPTDAWQTAATRVREGESNRAFAFFAVGVQDANFDVLQQISVRAPQRLDGLRFRDLFQWLSNSQKAVSRSQAGEEVQLPKPGWASI